MPVRNLFSTALAALVLCVAAQPLAAGAVTVGVQATNGNPGDSVEVQVFLTAGNGLVAGMQTDIAWDPSCLSVETAAGGAAACHANPAIPKQLMTKIRNNSSMRAVYLSLSDVAPIQQDAWLFACQFRIAARTTATQCPITLSNVIVADPKGGRLPVIVGNAGVRITQLPAPATNAAPGATGHAGGEGCAIAASRKGGHALLWLLIIPALVRLPRRRSR